MLASSSMASAGVVRGYGRIMYYENGANGGTLRPLAGVRVKLMDDDPVIDDVLKTGYTDADGRFDLTSPDTGDGLFGGKLDPYIEVELESQGGKVVVESEILKINVTCATATRPDTEGTINFGTLVCAGTGKDASTLFAMTRRAYDKFTSLTGESSIPRHNGKAAVLFPATVTAGVPFTTEESVHWPSGFRYFAGMFHEFGHRIRHAQDGDFLHFLSDVASYSYTQHHWLQLKTNNGFAFNEGWAEYYQAVNDNDAASQLANWSMLSNGANDIEGNVAAKLYKMSNACGGFGRMWSNLKGGSTHSYTEFANRMKATFQANTKLQTQHPACLSTIAALDGQKVIVTPKVPVPMNGRLQPIGANSPTGKSAQGPKVSEAEQTAALVKFAAEVKDRAAKMKIRNRLSTLPKLKSVGDKLTADQEDFEKRSAAKLEKHVKSLKIVPATKEALEKRRAEHTAFVKEILADRLVVMERALAQVKAERGKYTSGAEARDLDATKAKIEKTIAALKTAQRTGVVTRDLLPRSFSAPAEPAP